METDGRLPTGQSLGDAIKRVDDATSGYPAYFMINCAHPIHFDMVVQGDESWAGLIEKQLKNLNVLGGCCGTDHRHIEQITSACLPLFKTPS